MRELARRGLRDPVRTGDGWVVRRRFHEAMLGL
jgi:hypothetical protein